MASLVDLLNQYRVPNAGPPHRHVRIGWWGVPCPFCEGPGGTKYRMGFELATNRVSCWVCGIQYGPKVFEALFRIPSSQATALWFSIAKKQLTRELPKLQHILKNPDGLRELGPSHRKYLEGRNFDVDQITKMWEIKAIAMASRLQWRIFIPIFDQYHRQVSWTTRSVKENAGVRYISAAPEEEATPHKEILYGSHLASHVIIINEGPIDAWAWGPGGVGTLGVNYTQAQVNQMVQFPVRITCFDNVPDAQRRAHKLCTQLSAFPGTTENVILETGKDAASADKEEILEVRQAFGLG